MTKINKSESPLDLYRQWPLKSLVGNLYLVASPLGLCQVSFVKPPVPAVRTLSDGVPQAAWLAQAVREITEYLAGDRKEFTVKLDIHGTEFQKKVWRELQKIPAGRTRTYGEIAARIKHKSAIRAVGAANARNPLCILIPCHRVVSTSGRLVGYSGGLVIKRQLLELENREQRSARPSEVLKFR